MNKKDVIEKLIMVKPELAGRFGVTRLALFGSTARDAASEVSDVDVLVSFDGASTSSKFFGVQFLLEDMFGCRVDLVTEKALRAELRPYIEKDAIYV
jgi:predicted nucleotidyltransferase